jgi:hypothetical protein
LNQCWFGDCHSLLLLDFLPALVGGSLARGNLVEGAPFGRSPHVRVSREWQ